MENESKTPLVVEPKLAVRVYLLSRMAKHIDEALELHKTQVKSILGPTGKTNVNGLALSVSKPQSRDTFNPAKAAEALGASKYAGVELLIKAKVAPSDIPPAVLETLSAYFDIERRPVVTQGDADLAILNGDCEQYAVYDQGKTFTSLTLGSKKITNDQIATMYRELEPESNVLALIASSAPGDADPEE